MIPLYQVRGKHTAFVYYGYVTQPNLEPLEAFLLHAHVRPGDPTLDRGDVRMIRENNDDRTSLVAEVIAEFETELEAWVARNDERARDPLSVTGPTNFPTSIASRAPKEKVGRWQRLEQARQARTARDAWALGAWTNEQVRDLAAAHGKATVVVDLDMLSPTDFALKYQVKWEL